MQGTYKYRIKWFNLIAIVLSLYFMYLCIGQQSQLNAINNEADAVRVQLAQSQQMNTALKEERAALHDRKYVEKLAREELGLVKPGEFPYMIRDKK